jgi:hypothetical protein
MSRLIMVATLATLLTTLADAQVLLKRDDLAAMHGWVDAPKPTQDLTGQQTYKNAGWRQKMLKSFPEADADLDGTLTEAEAIQYHLSQARMFTPQGRELEMLPEGVTHETVHVAMRDGE